MAKKLAARKRVMPSRKQVDGIVKMELEIPPNGVELRLSVNKTIGTLRILPDGVQFLPPKVKREPRVIVFRQLVILSEALG